MIATTRWYFTALEFDVMWEGMRRDRLPFPLTWRANVATADELDRQRDAARHPVEDVNLVRALHILTSAVVRVHTCGFVDGAPGAQLHAAVSASQAVVVVQAADGIDIELMPAPDVISRITLPPKPPGKERGGTVTKSPGRAVMNNSGDDRQRLTDLVHRKRTGGGELLVGRTSRSDCRIDDITGGFLWIDVEGDGRYLLSGKETATVTPATEAATAALIGRYLAATA